MIFKTSNVLFLVLLFCLIILLIWRCLFLVGPLSSHKVARLTAGDSHTMTLTSEGKVFLWGVFRVSNQ